MPATELSSSKIVRDVKNREGDECNMPGKNDCRSVQVSSGQLQWQSVSHERDGNNDDLRGPKLSLRKAAGESTPNSSPNSILLSQRRPGEPDTHAQRALQKNKQPRTFFEEQTPFLTFRRAMGLVSMVNPENNHTCLST